MEKLNANFFNKNSTALAESLLGKTLCRKVDGVVIKDIITETEAYLNEQDSASHARFGKTKRNHLMWENGKVYIYLCYGMHYMFNITSGINENAGAVLIRATKNFKGPGILTKNFKITQSLNGACIFNSDEIWLEESEINFKIEKLKRIGINYANKKDINAKLRFKIKEFV